MSTIIHGCVNSDASTHSGKGFDANKIKKGLYEITYDTPFSEIPSVVLTQNHKHWNDFGHTGGKTTANCVLIASDKKHCRISTGNGHGSKKNRNFTFIAIGELEK